jgi:hypothetical protein
MIVENDEFFAFSVGAREFLVDGDDSYALVGGMPIVDKRSGSLDTRASVEIATDNRTVARPNPSSTLRV